MYAIVAPNLERLTYISFPFDDPPSVTLRQFRSKFTNVLYLSFHWQESLNSPGQCTVDTIDLCEVFPRVRYVELNTNQLPHLFDPTPSNARAHRPIDLWTKLESLTLCGLHPKWFDPNQLSAWLVNRQALGLRKLHVKLLPEYSSPGQSIDFKFSQLYEVLKENCILDLVNFRSTLPEIHPYAPVNSRLRVVSTFP